jgi:SAM-dependent methyltransferase
MVEYELTNTAKRSFDDVYNQSTPHRYLEEMSRIGYQIGEQARPYCAAVVDLLKETNPGAPTRILDIGCSYGIGSAFVKYGCSFEELVSYFRSRAPEDYARCVAATRVWLNAGQPRAGTSVIGLDVSWQAVQFALDSGLIDRGITNNLEMEDLAPEAERWLQATSLLICTGAIGYVGPQTFDRILRHLGQGRRNSTGPAAVMTILRMFDPSAVQASFERAGWEFRRIRGVRLPQRAFADLNEQRSIITAIEDRGLNPQGWESLGVMYADLYVAGKPGFIDRLESRVMQAAQGRQPQLFASLVAVATAKEESEVRVR